MNRGLDDGFDLDIPLGDLNIQGSGFSTKKE
jgi:hypothetical protein